MSTTMLSAEIYHPTGRQTRSPNRHTKGYGFVKAESSSDNTDVEDSDSKESDSKESVVESEDEFRRRAQSHDEKTVEKPEKNKERKHSLFSGRNQHAHEEKVKDGSRYRHRDSHSPDDNQNHYTHEEKKTKERKHSHVQFSSNHLTHEEKPKERKHSHSYFPTNHHAQEEKPKERKHSHSHFSMDHVKRKLSHTFTRRNSTQTSPELTQRKAPLKSKSAMLVTSSPEMMQRKAPLKSNSSSLVSGTPNELRRYALLMDRQKHDEPRGRCASSDNTEKRTIMHPFVMSRKRSSRKQFESASNPDIVSSTPYDNNGKLKDFNVYCLGTKQTGKTALAVRFLTGRYIHEYTSIPIEKYTRVMKYGGERVNVNLYISDTEKMEEDIELGSNSGIMIIYSITDKYSFKEATSLLRHLKILAITDHIPVVLVATKIDLNRLRKITERNASDLANQYNCSQFDVSAAVDDNVRECFHATFKQIEVRQYLKDSNDAIDDKNVLKARKCSSRESFLYSTL